MWYYLDFSDIKQMVLIHNSVHLMGEDYLWDPEEDLGRQRELCFYLQQTLCASQGADTSKAGVLPTTDCNPVASQVK